MMLRVKLVALAALAGAMGLLGCDKEPAPEKCRSGCTTVTGRFVTGPNGRDPLPGVKLTLVWFRGYGFFGRTDVRKKSVATSNANGEYMLRYGLTDEELNTGILDVDVAPLPYYGLNVIDVEAPRQRDITVTNPTYLLPRPATLVMQLANPQAMQATDRIDIYASTLTQPPLRIGYHGTSTGFSSPQNPNSVTQHRLDMPAELLIRLEVKRFRNSTLLSTSLDSLTLAPSEARNYPVQF
ncbi:hypothetical protein [Hymenobacter latericus]|uniref:hypothetical protein n=1 Tax=Hymenobacter sp. YIM 151858-1 TaxID=2987688 RepID=UPI0022268B63|nr:hypothetical protein [Hymenobacter sp. YIM 151858-1]UYZ58190.1 hypothetical protein OIS50_14115 [Hymenobacter sp. YIM 151858-1]